MTGVRSEHSDHPRAVLSRKWRARNKDKARAYYQNNLEKARDSSRRSRLKGFGITVEEYERMFKAQKGLCAICHLPSPNRRLDVDHDHVTLKVRQLLCRPCNHALGFMKDNPARLIAAAHYLHKHAAAHLAELIG